MALTPETIYNDAVALNEVADEVKRASQLHGPMASAHEGWSVILEELDELWEEVRKKRSARDPKQMRKEAIETAAMALRFASDVTPLSVEEIVYAPATPQEP